MRQPTIDTVQWWGKPGFIDSTYLMNFWAPLPSHLWSQIPAGQLADSPGPSHSPVGWGPYVIQEWVTGDHITLTKNPHYFRASEGLPKVSTLTFRFVPDPATAVSDLIAGSCDILDPSINLGGQVDLLRSMADKKQLQLSITTPPVMEQLAFGIRPAAYDNGYNPADRPDLSGRRARPPGSGHVYRPPESGGFGVGRAFQGSGFFCPGG